MDITYTRAVSRSRRPVRWISGQGSKAKCAPERCIRPRESESLLEVGAVQPTGCRRVTSCRSLRATSQHLDRIVLEFMEIADPCVGLAAAHMHAQLGVSRHATPHLHEEDGDE